jgi:hypothetical protein
VYFSLIVLENTWKSFASIILMGISENMCDD